MTSKPGSPLFIEEFRTSARLIVRGQRVTLHWKTSDAKTVRIVEEGREDDPIPTDGFLSGEHRVEPKRDTAYLLAAAGYSEGGDDGQPSEKRISVAVVPLWRPVAVLASIVLVIVATWVIKQQLFAPVDLVENDPTYVTTQRALEIFGFVTALLGAPLVLTITRLSSPFTIKTVSSRVLRSTWLTGFVVCICLVALFFSGRLLLRARQVRIENGLSTNVTLRGKDDGAALLVVPPGGTTALLFRDPETLILHGAAEPEQVTRTCVADSAASTSADEKTCEHISFTCKREIEVLVAGASTNVFQFRALWDDGRRSVGVDGVAERSIDDCSSFPSKARIELEDQRGRSVAFDVPFSATRDQTRQRVRMESLDFDFGLSVPGGHLAVEAFSRWKADAGCATQGCSLLVPMARSAPTALCLSSSPTARPGVDCDRSQLFLSIEGRALSEVWDKGCKIEKRTLCVPSRVRPDSIVSVAHDGLRWRAPLASLPSEEQRSVPVVSCLDTPVRVSVGSEESEVSLESDTVIRFADEVLPSFTVTAFRGNERLLRGKLALDEPDDPCEWLSATEGKHVGEGRYRIVGLPQSFRSQSTQWKMQARGGTVACKLARKGRGWGMTCL